MHVSFAIAELAETLYGESQSASCAKEVQRCTWYETTHVTAQMRPTTVAVGMALGQYTFHDILMPLMYGSHTVKYARITMLILKHATLTLNQTLNTFKNGFQSAFGMDCLEGKWR